MKNFLIVGTQRTGSSSIAESIGLHPAIACGWEWTLHVARHRKISVAKSALSGDFQVLTDAQRAHIESVCGEQCEWLGFRNLFRSSDKWLLRPTLSLPLWLDAFTPFVDWIKQTSDLHVIHVVRHDNLAWIRSKYVSRQTGTFVGASYPEDLKVRVNTVSAVRRVIAKQWLDTRLAQLQETNPYIRIDYEQYAHDAANQVRRSWDFLGCAPADIDFSRKRVQRQSTVPPDKQIRNYDALIQALEARDLLWDPHGDQRLH